MYTQDEYECAYSIKIPAPILVGPRVEAGSTLRNQLEGLLKMPQIKSAKNELKPTFMTKTCTAEQLRCMALL